MTTVLRIHKPAGRFGREVRGEDVATADTMATDGEGARFATAGYVVDAAAVAAAIVERLLAGRTLAVAPPRERRQNL